MNEPLQKTGKTVIIAIPVLLIGGTEIQTLDAVRMLIRDDYNVTVCCYYEYDSTVVAEFESAGATILLLKLARSLKTFSYRQLFELFRILYKTFRTARPDVVHVQYVAPGLVPILAAKLAGVNKIFATIHYPLHVYDKRVESFVRIAARLCTMFICNSLATERSWFGTGTLLDSGEFNPRLRHCTIYNAIDIQKIRKRLDLVHRTAMKNRLGIRSKYVIGVVARLRSEKGHSFLFHAMKQMLESAPSTSVVIVGDGPDKSMLQSLAKKLHITDSILWLGSKSQEETFQLYGMMDVLVVPSEFEGFGLSAAEAMAAGVPVVASNVYGLREVVEDGVSGILVPFGDVEKMTSSLLAILFDAVKAKEMGNKGRERAENLFSLARFRKATSIAYKMN